jgi:protease IV
MDNKKIFGLITFVIILMLVSFIFASISGLMINNVEHGNVAVIKLWGPITLGSSSSLFSETISNSNEIISLIEKAQKNDNIKAIIIDINSPGGSPVASDEISEALKQGNKTTVSVIREVGTSGAYWVASATDHIIANRMSITGSIGAYSSYLEFAGLLEDYNVTYRVIKSGKYKDAGSPFKELTPEEMHLIQERVDIIHNFFVEEIANNRNLSVDKVKDIANGMIYLGSESVDLGLIDQLGSFKEAINYIEDRENIKVQLVEYKVKRSFFDSFFSIFNKNGFSISNLNQNNILI